MCVTACLSSVCTNSRLFEYLCTDVSRWCVFCVLVRVCRRSFMLVFMYICLCLFAVCVSAYLHDFFSTGLI